MGSFSVKDTVVLASSEQDEAMARRIAIYTGALWLDVFRERFYDGEGAYQPRIMGSVRNKLVVIVASVIIEPMVRQMELNFLIGAACHSQADEILVIMPYNSWARSDKKDASGIPYGFQVIVKGMEAVAERSQRRISVILCDLHNDSTAPLFRSVDVITVKNILLQYVRESGVEVVMALDTGGVKSAKKAAQLLGVPHGVVDKNREKQVINVTGVGGVDVRGKTVLATEDEIARGSTVAAGARMLYKDGANELTVACSHAVFYSGVDDVLWADDAPPIRVVTTNTTPITPLKKRLMDEGKLVIIDVCDWMGEGLRRWLAGMSLGMMHEYDKQSQGCLGWYFETTEQRGLVRWVVR